ncbi:non-ribosomal peptide synthetase [Lysobacter hankyongensis]|uniref:non-ribosomal peptide synthetase n=1 Tax=Lysobacter hankyongensis TaxID=1176535 RepID=UPI0031E85E1A
MSSDFVSEFERCVREYSDSVAVVDDDRRRTYRELNAAANRLARRLSAEGVRTDAIVPIHAERSLEFLIGILAVFKAGGAYLPIDPNWPVGRVSEVLSESGSGTALVSGAASATLREAAALASNPNLRIVDLEEDVSAHVDDDLPIAIRPGDLAYVIFTSGSTGRPKGAMVEHRGMFNHLQCKLDELRMDDRDRLVQNAPQCFDISVWQFLCPLLVGGEVHIVRDAIAHDPVALFGYASAHGITLLEAVPSLIKSALAMFDGGESPREGALDRLRVLMLTGEALEPSVCRGWLARFPAVPIVNAYGPTECSDDVTHFWMRTPPDESDIRVPIGHSIANIRLYVVEEGVSPLRLCEPGEPGELCVAGIAVGRGYVNNPEATRKAFMDDPFAESAPPDRLYRTGDLVRQREDGAFDYLGRIDRQVKIRGRRIELEEIEQVLLRSGMVRDCAVVARSLRPGAGATGEMLVAYVVARAEFDPAALERTLCERLPAYMVPAHIVRLQSMPLTPNGKIDVSDLMSRELATGTDDVEIGYATECQAWLAGIWSSVLQAERIPPQADFFDLGGSSLDGIKLLYAIRKASGIALTYDSIEAHPTLAGMAEVLAPMREAASAPATPS